MFANELQSSTTRFTAHIELNMEKYRKKSKLFELVFRNTETLDRHYHHNNQHTKLQFSFSTS